MTMNTTNKEIKEKEERLLSFKQEVEGLRNISDAEEYAKQLAHLFLGNGLSLQTILLMAIDFGQQHPNWISVEDELPPPHYEGANSTDFVLVYDGYDLEFGYYDFEQKNWHGEDYKEMMFDITHWMPLPMPPQGKEE